MTKKNIMMILTAALLVFSACAVDGKKITEKELNETTWTGGSMMYTTTFHKNKKLTDTSLKEGESGTWSLSKIKIEDYVAARIGLGDVENMIDQSKNKKNTTVYAVTMKLKTKALGEEIYTNIVADKYFNGYSFTAVEGFILIDYDDLKAGDSNPFIYFNIDE